MYVDTKATKAMGKLGLKRNLQDLLLDHQLFCEDFLWLKDNDISVYLEKANINPCFFYI